MGQTLNSRILILGLEDSGKTAFLDRVRFPSRTPTPLPTIAYDIIQNFKYKGIQFEIWDVTGKANTRSLWSNYYSAGSVDAIVWVIDASNRDTLKESRTVLETQMREPKLEGVMLFVMANKQDVEGALDTDAVIKGLKLNNYTNKRVWKCYGVSAQTGNGVKEAMKDMAGNVKQYLLGQAPIPGKEAVQQQEGGCCSCCPCSKKVEYINE